MLKKILIVIAVLIAGLLVAASMQPKEFVFERSIVINSSADKIFALVNSPKKMNEWNPWLESDPNVVLTYEGPEEGVGAKNSWAGNKDIGVGSATIVESVQNQLVKSQLDFKEPMESTNYVSYILTPEGEGTRVAWRMEGKNNLIGRILCLFMDMDEMMNTTFDKGLNKLKTMIEAQK